MKNIDKIDKNFHVDIEINKEGLTFYDCSEAPFDIYGLLKPTQDNPHFIRMDQIIADHINEGVAELNRHCAGGRVRFKTNSSKIAIHANEFNVGAGSHFTLTGTGGFDLYEITNGKEVYLHSFVPPYGMKTGYESLVDLEEKKEREFSINFPLYSGVQSFFIGIDSDASLSKACGYKHTTPIVYYGSSITQGGCASRPGNTYQAMISRRFNTDYVNLGFSGSAMGEEIMAEYIASLDMQIFVYDYDYNSPTAETLKSTHEKMFKIIRSKKPNLPIIILSKPFMRYSDSTNERFDIIKQTYDNAISNNDKNVYLIDGRHIMDLIGEDSGTVDDCHPNDLGFFCMAKKIGDIIELILDTSN